MSVSEKSPERALLVGAAAGLVVGCLIGWFIIGWWLWPVQYVGDAYTYELNEAEKAEYVAAVVDSYDLTRRVDVAAPRFAGWETEEKVSALARLFAEYQVQGRTQEAQGIVGLTAALNQMETWDSTAVSQATDQLVTQYQDEGSAEQAQFVILFASEMGLVTAGPTGEQVAPAATFAPQVTRPGLGGVGLWLALLLALILVAALAILIVFLVRRQRLAPTTAMSADESEWLGEGPLPLLTRKSVYRLGMDNFDESFSIEGEDGSFRGECGVGISEAMGEDTPRRVLAFEVWLFDKSDIRTVTKVLVSDHAYENEALRNKLAARGEPILAAPGTTIMLETTALAVEARVDEMEYGDGTPPSSYFNKLTVSLTARVKSDAASASWDDISPLPNVEDS